MYRTPDHRQYFAGEAAWRQGDPRSGDSRSSGARQVSGCPGELEAVRECTTHQRTGDILALTRHTGHGTFARTRQVRKYYLPHLGMTRRPGGHVAVPATRVTSDRTRWPSPCEVLERAMQVPMWDVRGRSFDRVRIGRGRLAPNVSAHADASPVPIRQSFISHPDARSSASGLHPVPLDFVEHHLGMEGRS